jgi:hypothetical protein
MERLSRSGVVNCIYRVNAAYGIDNGGHSLRDSIRCNMCALVLDIVSRVLTSDPTNISWRGCSVRVSSSFVSLIGAGMGCTLRLLPCRPCPPLLGPLWTHTHTHGILHIWALLQWAGQNACTSSHLISSRPMCFLPPQWLHLLPLHTMLKSPPPGIQSQAGKSHIKHTCVPLLGGTPYGLTFSAHRSRNPQPCGESESDMNPTHPKLLGSSSGRYSRKCLYHASSWKRTPTRWNTGPRAQRERCLPSTTSSEDS